MSCRSLLTGNTNSDDRVYAQTVGTPMVFRVSTVMVGAISRSALDHNYYMAFEVFGVNVFNEKPLLITSGTIPYY